MKIILTWRVNKTLSSQTYLLYGVSQISHLWIIKDKEKHVQGGCLQPHTHRDAQEHAAKTKRGFLYVRKLQFSESSWIKNLYI